MKHMQCRAIGIRVDRDRRQSQLPASADHAQSNLAAICNQNFSDRPSQVTFFSTHDNLQHPVMTDKKEEPPAEERLFFQC
jgi:hypothetical protein